MGYTGVTSRGISAPIFKQGDDLVEEVVKCVVTAGEHEGFSLHEKDIVAVTESVLARTQGNYATVDDIAADVKSKFNGEEVGIVFPILSRNRFSVLLAGIAKGVKKLYVQLSYPADEVGNQLISWDDVDEMGVDPYTDCFDEAGFRKLFPNTVHRFTGVDYIEFYKSFSDNVEIIFANDPKYILNYTKNVIASDIHTLERTKRILKKAGAKVYGLDEILTKSINGSGYNPEYGLLGSNKADDTSVKLFPRDAQPFVEKLQARFVEVTGVKPEVMVYGDGCFHDPVGGIWEFADPVVAPGFTSGLNGTPNELKIKYLADHDMADKTGDDLNKAMKEAIEAKDSNLVGNMVSEGTTPRRYTDLIGSLCDLTSGSGDKGTPIILIQGYFSNYSQSDLVK